LYKMEKIEKKLLQELNLDREFYTDLEHFVMSLMHTYEKLIKVSNEFFAKYDLTETQFNALMALADHQHYKKSILNQKDLADRLLIKKASAGTLIDRLRKNNWVKIEGSELDKRAKNISLTEEGLQKFNEVFEPYYCYMVPLMDGISKDEFMQALTTMHKVRKNFSKL
jgi:MarR family multiple gene transcriptional regulator MgrA